MRAVFYGLGADGTVGANKNSVKIIAEDAGLYAQGYFVYDSHKSGAQTISHLRFGPQPIRSPYLIGSANFVGCHQFHFLQRQDVLRLAAPGATFLLNSPYGAAEVWDRLPRAVQQQIIDKKLQVLRHRCEPGGAGGRPQEPHQYRAADLLLRDLGRAAARRGDRADQEVDPQDLRLEGRSRSCSRTSRPSIDTLSRLHEVPVRPRRPARSSGRLPCPRARPSSCAR